LTKSNQLGVVLDVDGIDAECLTDATLETYTKRAAAAWRSFDEHFRLYQHRRFPIRKAETSGSQ
jgi:hypothetical protein